LAQYSRKRCTTQASEKARKNSGQASYVLAAITGNKKSADFFPKNEKARRARIGAKNIAGAPLAPGLIVRRLLQACSSQGKTFLL